MGCGPELNDQRCHEYGAQAVMSRKLEHLLFAHKPVTRLLLRALVTCLHSPLLVVLVYHRIVDRSVGSVGYLDYDMGEGYEQFESQMRSLSRQMRFLTLEEFLAMLSGKAKLTGNSCLLTFDDADSSFLELAFPVLQEYALPSVVFVPTAFVGANMRFWHLRVTNAVHRMTQSQHGEIINSMHHTPRSVQLCLRRHRLGFEGSRRVLARSLCRCLDHERHDTIEAVVGHIESVVGPQYDIGIRCLDWDEIRDLAARGVSFQSHARTHRKLEQLSTTEIVEELGQSKATLEQQLGLPVEAICYPAGSFDQRVLRIAKECGYSLGFTSKRGCVSPGVQSADAFALRRIGLKGQLASGAELTLSKVAIRSVLVSVIRKGQSGARK